jgi:peptidoglycan hydrolase CwlO-like protein
VRIQLKIGIAAALALCTAAISGIALAGAADPGLKTMIDSARDEASLISSRITTQSSRVAQLEARAAEAAQREQELQAQLEEATARSTELNGQLISAEAELDSVRARYKRAVELLAEHLVAIYKEPEPDYLDVVLESEDFDDLQTRSEYLEQLTDQDERIAGRVSELHEEVEARYGQIAGLKADIEEQAQQLEGARAEIADVRAEAERDAAGIDAARAEAQAALGELQQRISGWELEVRKQAAEEISEGSGVAFLGGPYAIPTYIVICESGGNYRALNPSSMAGGAYQIIPSTWRAYGGEGRYAHVASKAEQDRIAAIIWREDGPGAWSCA